MEHVHIIRTSDRNTYRACRQQWDWVSKIRRNLEPAVRYAPFEDGSTWHDGLETYYEPSTWHLLSDESTAESVRHAARERLLATHNRNVTTAQQMSGGDLPSEMLDQYDERLKTLQGMLDHYFMWASKADRFKPIKVEVEFEVPILDPTGREAKCECHGWAIVYQGRLDGLVENYDFGNVWIKEHKTTGQMGRTEHLDLDPQCGSYAWAVQQQLGIPIGGIIYTQALKKAPHPPKRLLTQRQGRWYSTNKQQRTTHDIFLRTLQENNEDPKLYQDFLLYLKEEGNPFFRRIEVHRNQHSLDYVGRMIYFEAMEMVHNPTIYPNPSYFNCNGCRFREPCIAKQNGYDHEFILEELFVSRD